MYCLDTSVIIAIFRGDSDLAKKISMLESNAISFTTITLCELLKGAYKARQKEKALDLIKDFSNTYNVLTLTAVSCEIFGRDFNALLKSGKAAQEPDLMIAGIAKENGLILVTRNRKHFENVPDMLVEEW